MRRFCAFVFWQHRRGRAVYQVLYRKWRPQTLCRRGRAAAGHRHPQKRAEIRPTRARLPVHRLARHRQNHLRQNSGQSGQLPAPRGRRPVRRMRNLPRDRQRRRHRRHWRSTPPATTAWTTSGTCARRSSSPPPRPNTACISSTRCICCRAGAFNALLKTLEEPPAHVDVHSGDHRGA